MIKKILILILGLILISGCVENQPEEKFCGSSSYGPCNIDSDCRAGGCSSQVCRSKSEDAMITICDYRECYDASKYNLECKCVDNGCQWAKK